ncbi:hypothetical protein ACKWTF_003437 [Chironomus riparius]
MSLREDINNLHTNVEFLTNRINSASTIIANNNAMNEAYTNETEPISSSIHSSPQNYDVNLSASYIQPEKSQYTVVDDINANTNNNNNNLVTNYSISNNSSYEPPTSLSASQIDNNVTPTRSIIRSNSIRNINDDDIQPNYYNETIQPSSISYVEPQPASVSNNNFQRTDSGEWNRGQRSTDSFVPPTNAMETYQQQQQSIDYGQFDYEKRRDSRPPSRSGSRSGSRSNSRPSSRPISRASSQQRFSEEPEEYRQPQRSLSRNDSQRSLTDYQQQQRQPDPIITTRINESYMEPEPVEIRKPSVTFKNDEYEQQSQNIQQMAEQRSPVYTNSYQLPQQTYQEPIYTDQSNYRPQQEYEYTPTTTGYSTGPSTTGYSTVPTTGYSTVPSTTGYSTVPTSGYATTTPTVYEQPQYEPVYQSQQQYEPVQPVYESESRRQSPEKEIAYQQSSRRQSPENEYYEQPTRYSESRRQSPELEYQPPRSAYVEPETPRRYSPPKRESPPREEVENKVVQQRQQSIEKDDGNTKTYSPRQQSRDNLSPEQFEKPSPLPQPKATIPIPLSPPITTPSQNTLKGPGANPTSAKQVVPSSPKRGGVARNSKVGIEQKAGRNAMGEATGVGRKSDNVQKQPPKAVTNIRGKK